ncbi:hypothetical protein DAEQUDRAFT_766245 [Daedalea quercina L-15889]|uniref:Uncharacterized protein n=1 Tax=Daedalea quercina L-15889 TaxID=1314783 RepID=A0A165PNI3_9APHY|nr:hypothetical protein DAEQUDRAFT_766245 [Daedalea quercina L-15889]
MARLVTAMDVGKARNSDSVEITPDVAFITGAVCHPGPFVCSIRPRSEKAKQLILDSCVNL